MPPPRALHIPTHPRELELPVKRAGTGIMGYGLELWSLDACLYETSVFDFTIVRCCLPQHLQINATPRTRSCLGIHEICN